MLEYRTVLLAALFHDIGKLLQKGQFSGSLKIKGKHPQVSADFISSYWDFFKAVSDVDLLYELVKRHHERTDYPPELQAGKAKHEIRSLAYLISKADNYSSMERGESFLGRRNYKTTSLMSIFSRVRLDDNKPVPEPKSYNLSPLNPATAFPNLHGDLDYEDINSFLSEFGKEFNGLANRLKGKSFDVVFSHLVSLLHRYTWCIPSNTQEEIPDVSLYDHLSTTCAIAACLYRFHSTAGILKDAEVNDSETHKFRIVVGDLSGIQKYIFSVATGGVKGVGKRLRARSFFLGALTEAVAHCITRHFELPLCNIIISSGGRFYILVPNHPEAATWLDTLQRELDKWSVISFSGEIRINLAHIFFRGGDFEKFGVILEEVNALLSERKARQLDGFLIRDGKWAEDAWLGDSLSGENGICSCCGRRPAKQEIDGLAHCSECLRDLRLGTLLANARYITYHDKKSGEPTGTHYFDVFSSYFAIHEELPHSGSKPYIAIKLNETDLSELFDHPAMFRFLTNYVSLATENVCKECSVECEEEQPRPGSPLYFDCMAASSRGKKVLGYLKADVDNLGSIFILGFKTENADFTTISRVASVSRMIDLYFAGWVQQLLAKKFPTCYTVFSGGDDLLIIGPWDQIIELALCIHKDFERFTGGNPHITLSAGVTLAKVRTPLNYAVSEMSEAIDQAKKKPVFGSKEGRNQICLFGQVARWPDFEMVLNAGKKLAE